MAPSYKFSVIQARPDKMRGERVNVGIIVHGPDGADVRLPEIRKLIPLTGHHWDDVAAAFSKMIADTVEGKSPPSGSEVFAIGNPGDLTAANPHEYEAAVKDVLRFFVDKPRLSRKEKQNKINSEISHLLKHRGVLGERGQSIDEGKVISKFVVSAEKDIVADFAYKPNKLKVVSTLDLRGLSSAAHGRACEKGATLYFAKERYHKEMTPFGVYAASPTEAQTHRSEIEILRSFSDGNSFNWSDARDRQKFVAAFY